MELLSRRPALPSADVRGTRPALATVLAMIGQDIFDARQKAGMSLSDLAKAAGLRIETVSAIERGERIPATATLRRLGKALGREW